MPFTEPTPQTLTNPLLRLVLATRPAFLSASALAALLGLATAAYDGVAIGPATAVLTVVGAMVVHAGINVLNDYYDALGGSDELNHDRIFPFTGGSRFIQNGVWSPRQMGRFGWGLLAMGSLIGGALVAVAGPGLLGIGLAGLVLGWAYSARGVNLVGRGFGEVAVAVGFGVLVPLGADWVQRQAFAWTPLAAGVPFGLVAMNLLFVNQFPDHRADAAAGKRHWVVRLGPRRARWLYGAIALGAHGGLVAAVAAGTLPPLALLALVSLWPASRAWLRLIRFAEVPAFLEPAIRRSISALVELGVLLAGVLAVAG
ncbi:prenyltransferase [Thiohalorhabdus sp.]|uniref:prenyltransferase n=1 Tax=Thiohalorhabdus sp. TaxID=3094134 RepID=UPI002FC2DEE0